MIQPRWMPNEWTESQRLNAIRELMIFSSRDWAEYPMAIPREPDRATWIIYILTTANSKEEALKMWNDFLKQYKLSDS